MKSIAVVISFFIASPAIAAGLPNTPLIENIATLSMATRWCEDYVVDLKSALVLAIEKNVNPMKPPYEKVFDDTKEKLEKVMGEVGVSRFCSVTYERFKPGGVVPGFMMKR